VYDLFDEESCDVTPNKEVIANNCSRMTVQLLENYQIDDETRCQACDDNSDKLFVIKCGHGVSLTLCPNCISDMIQTIRALAIVSFTKIDIGGVSVPAGEGSVSELKEEFVKATFGETCDRCGSELGSSSVALDGMLLCPDCGLVELQNRKDKEKLPWIKPLNLPKVKKQRVV